MNRREFHRWLLAGLGSTVGGAWFASSLAARAQDLRWTCRVVTFDPEPMHNSPPVITDLCVQRDGQLLALVGDDHLVRLCSKRTGELLGKLRGHEDWVRCVAFHPDGSRLVSAGNDRTILEWNLLDGELLRPIGQPTAAIACLAIDPAGQRLATAGFEPQITLYDVESGQVIGEWEAPDDDMRTLAFSPDGDLLAAGGRSGVLRIFEVSTGARLRDVSAHRRRIHRVLFSQDGRTLISCAEDRLVKITPLDGETSIALPRRPCKVQSIALIGPHLLASAGSDNLIRLWDPTTQEEVDQLAGHRGTVTSLAFDGDAIYSGSYDTELRIWTASAETAIR